MSQKLWNKCKKCGCDKPEDSGKMRTGKIKTDCS